MKDKFTSCDWGPASSLGNDGYGRYEHSIAGGKITIRQNLLGSNREEIEANVRLILAARKMLAACRLALPHHQGRHSVVGDALIDAIADVEGRS